MRLILTLLICLWAPNASAVETYDLIFKNGTLSALSDEDTLVYNKSVSIRDKEEDAAYNTGQVKLTFEPDEMARLKFHKGEKFRNIGSFPATVGNPIIMYFVETVIRDVSANAGGSPFYIRNRVKDALVKFAEIETKSLPFDGAEVPVQQITLRPFLGDKNVPKMRGYGELALTITMSDDVPGWYYSLAASAKGTEGTVYNYELTLIPEQSQ